jgi:hypothetical protein
MTKINHNRPSLKLLDNFRRELGIDARRTDTLSFGVATSSQNIHRSNIFPLSAEESKVTSRLFDAIEGYINIEEAIVAALNPKATKAGKTAGRLDRRKKAESELKSAGIAFCSCLVVSALQNRKNLQYLYLELKMGLTDEAPFLWEVINDVAMRAGAEAIQIVAKKHFDT